MSRRPYYYKFSSWYNLLIAGIVVGFDGFLFGRGSWAGWVMLPMALLWLALGVWTIRWRWLSDMRHARTDGERHGFDRAWMEMMNK